MIWQGGKEEAKAEERETKAIRPGKCAGRNRFQGNPLQKEKSEALVCVMGAWGLGVN
jgi:hypothetical protein